MIRAIIESPYGGTPEEVERNTVYARRCMLWALQQGYAPFLSHLLYTQVLNDNNPEERKLGIEAGFAWREFADITLVFLDYGATKGMRLGIRDAKMKGRRVKEERIGKNPYDKAIDCMAETIAEEVDRGLLEYVEKQIVEIDPTAPAQLVTFKT